MADDEVARLHAALMELVRLAGAFQPDRAVPGEEVSLSQTVALHELDVAGPMSQRDLAQRVHLEKSTVSRMVADMERKGLVERERDPGNRRLYRLRITDRGRAAHARIAAHFHGHYVRWMAAMTESERDALIVGFPALVRAIRHDLDHLAQSECDHEPPAESGGAAEVPDPREKSAQPTPDEASPNS